MGTLDRFTYTLECPQCHATEEGQVLDKGSMHGGSYWLEGPDFTNFNTKWKGSAKDQPQLIGVPTCNSCGTEASVSSKFG